MISNVLDHCGVLFSPVDYDGLDTPVKSSSDRLFIQPCLDIMSSPVAYLSECISQEDIL